MNALAQPLDPAPAARTERLAAGFDSWSRSTWWRHALCLAVLALLSGLRWGALLADREPLGDEPAYRAAFLAAAAGASPYEGTDFLYPAALAYAGAWGAEQLGLDATFFLLRAANLVGLVVVLWCSLAWLPWTLRQRLALGAAILLLSPQIAHAVRLGNLSLAASGLVIAALLLVSRAPLGAGGMLGASLALKPIAPMVVPCLVLAADPERRRERVRAAVAAGLVALALVLAFPHGGQILALTATPRVATTVSLHRLAALLGLQINALWISLPLALAALFWLRRLRLGPARFLCFATATGLTVLPLVWSHTLILLLPLEVLALTVAIDRHRRPRGSRGQVPWLEPALVVLAVASLQLAAGAGGIDDQGLLVQAAGALLPALAPIALLGYLIVHTEAF